MVTQFLVCSSTTNDSAFCFIILVSTPSVSYLNITKTCYFKYRRRIEWTTLNVGSQNAVIFEKKNTCREEGMNNVISLS